MAKRKTQLIPTKYKTKLLTAAGIFAAGSVVGSALEIPPMSAYFEIIAPDSVKTAETDVPSSSPAETFQTLSSETETPYVPPETAPAPAVPAPTVPAVPTPEGTTEAAPSPEQPPVQNPVPAPEPSVPAVTPTPVPEPEQDADWMEGIFVPADPVPEAPELWEDDWMDTLWPAPDSAPEPSVTVPTVPTVPDTSSMTEELASMLENVAVFWSTADNKIHLDPACTSAPVVFAGTVEEAQTVRTNGWCRRCAEHLDGTDNTVFYVKGNSYAVFDAVAASYTYSDYQNGIPAGAFGG